MAVDMSTMLYLPVMDMFSRTLLFTPLRSNPSGGNYSARGFYTTDDVDVMAEGGAMLSDQRTVIDIRDNEFTDLGRELPAQGDLVFIAEEGNLPEEGLFEITDTDRNGGGLTTLTIRKYIPADPLP